MKFFYFHPDFLEEHVRSNIFESLVIQKKDEDFIFNVCGKTNVFSWHTTMSTGRADVNPKPVEDGVELVWKEITEEEALKFLIKYGASMP